MKKRNAKVLWERYQNNLATDEEKAIVESWYNQIDGPAPSHEQQLLAMKAVAGKLPLKKQGIAIRLWTAGIAAAIVLIVTSLYFFRNEAPDSFDQKNHYATHIKPGKNSAYLVLADGKTVVLSDSSSNTLSEQAGIRISTTAGGQLVYTVTSKAAVNAGTQGNYNTLTTPKGGQYQVILPDGTHVWLNAASSLTYPTTFTGNERKVELKGEGYFEVTKTIMKRNGGTGLMPFVVKTDKQEIEVLGTHFNVNAYADEAAEKTTLLEGSVKVTAGNAVTVIKPGEQALLAGQFIDVSNVDADQAVAWKNGIFNFKKADIETIMRQIARWYDVEVAYDGKIPDDLFVGKIRRSASITDVLRIFTLSNVHYKIEGRKIIIRK